MIREFTGSEGLTARVLEVPGARNLRELGGYRMSDGRRVKQGMVYRGGHPGGISAEHLPLVGKLCLSATVDLRTTEERSDLPFPDFLVGSTHYWTRDYELSRGNVVRLLRDPVTDPAAMRRHMIESYARFPEEQRDGIEALLRLLLDGRTPVLVNCTAGKDRTGVACALLLAALGADHELIRQDYALTEQLHDPSSQLFSVDPDGPFAYLLQVDPQVWRTMMRSDPAYIDATFKALEEHHGGTERYLEVEHGIGRAERERLRDLLLED